MRVASKYDNDGNFNIAVFEKKYLLYFKPYLEGLVKILLLKLELEQGTIHLVHQDNGLDTLSNGLTQNGLGLDTDT
jgi:hypothetical protein